MSKTNKRSRSAEPSDVIPSKRAHHTSVVDVSQTMHAIAKFRERIQLVCDWTDRAGYEPIVHEFNQYYYNFSNRVRVHLISSDIETMAHRAPRAFWEASERARFTCQAIELNAMEHSRVAKMDFSTMAAWACPEGEGERKKFQFTLERTSDSVSVVCELRYDAKKMSAELEVLDFKLPENIDNKVRCFLEIDGNLYAHSDTKNVFRLGLIYMNMGSEREVSSSPGPGPLSRAYYRPDITAVSGLAAMGDVQFRFTPFSLREKYLASEFPKMLDDSLPPVLIAVVRQYYGMGYVRPLNSESEAAKQFDLEHNGRSDVVVVSDDDDDLPF